MSSAHNNIQVGSFEHHKQLLKARRYTLIVFSNIELLIALVYNVFVRKTYFKNELDNGDVENDKLMFDIITYFGITFSLCGLITAVIENKCFALTFASINLMHVVVCLIKTIRKPIFFGYILVNVLLSFVSLLYARHLAWISHFDSLARSTNNSGRSQSPEAGNQISTITPLGTNNSSLFHVESFLFKPVIVKAATPDSQRPPSYNEVSKHPNQYPMLFDQQNPPSYP